jgi:hypothetical protein
MTTEGESNGRLRCADGRVCYVPLLRNKEGYLDGKVGGGAGGGSQVLGRPQWSLIESQRRDWAGQIRKRDRDSDKEESRAPL